MSLPLVASPANPLPANAVSVQSLGSGSSGNAFLIQSGETCIMLDCGVGIKTINRALKERNRLIGDLDAVLITHEHSDHIKTLSSVIGREVPIVSTAGTRRRANIPPPQWEQIAFDRPVVIGETSVWAIMVKHDAAEPCGFLIETPTTRISVFTDLGSWHERLVDPIAASDLVVLESNHDEAMLQGGPYPAYLKRRVASPVGHLSNAVCAMSLASTLGQGNSRPEIWLAHLSDTNNRPDLAKDEVQGVLVERGLDLNVTPLPRQSPGPIWTPGDARSDTAWKPHPRAPISTQLSLDSLM
jgi:phosphoribosyl 1,2-cyclic phosphodiesterase